MKNPQQVAQKWANRLNAATTEITNGVNAVVDNPAEQAIAKKQKLVQNFNAAVNDGRWERGLRSVTLQSWKDSMLTKGLPRIGQGATAGQPKMAAFMQALLPYQENLKATVDNMPDLTIEDSVARAGAWIRGMAQFSK